MSFNVNFHYGGKFVKDNAIYYLGRHEHIVDIDPDKWSFFEATGIVKDLSHLSIRNISYGVNIYVKHKVNVEDECGVNDDDDVNVEDEGCLNDDDNAINIEDEDVVNDDNDGVVNV
ncbi:hypothetical protein KIW84_062177 [Lathyrus oleraceus]|uniref:PB1-like domain-containing protein n=1 Tax=Pisum sativum TaxID=3888 RepID=A0A9D4W5S5_PEA|nr:hypothetical protein KIW84_062177 [Pisum sativum]